MKKFCVQPYTDNLKTARKVDHTMGLGALCACANAGFERITLTKMLLRVVRGVNFKL